MPNTLLKFLTSQLLHEQDEHGRVQLSADGAQAGAPVLLLPLAVVHPEHAARHRLLGVLLARPDRRPRARGLPL